MQIAILIPCYNEELTIAKVINDFRHELPEAMIYVFDNNSTDQTHQIAKKNGAIVYSVYQQGKGNVVRAMFQEIEADIYVMVDGDDTYAASDVHKLIAPIQTQEADMVTGDRFTIGDYNKKNKRRFHSFGNGLVKNTINRLFKAQLNDIMTGYRAFNHKFVKNIPIMSAGFEIETEMTLHTLQKRFVIKEIPINYQNRPQGSFSKLNTISDGFKVMMMIFNLFKSYRPFAFFSFFATILLLTGVGLGIPIVLNYLKTGLVPKIPTLILIIALGITSAISLAIGLILDIFVQHQKENYELNLKQHN